jgi:hypothetical protein
MTDLRPAYTVFLKHDIPDVERELLRRHCHELHGADGHTLLHFLCTRANLAHAHYLEMDVVAPRQRGHLTLRVPHDYVLMIEVGTDDAGMDALGQNAALRLD